MKFLHLSTLTRAGAYLRVHIDGGEGGLEVIYQQLTQIYLTIMNFIYYTNKNK